MRVLGDGVGIGKGSREIGRPRRGRMHAESDPEGRQHVNGLNKAKKKKRDRYNVPLSTPDPALPAVPRQNGVPAGGMKIRVVLPYDRVRQMTQQLRRGLPVTRFDSQPFSSVSPSRRMLIIHSPAQCQVASGS